MIAASRVETWIECVPNLLILAWSISRRVVAPMVQRTTRDMACALGRWFLRPLWNVFSADTTRDGNHSPRCVALHDIVAALEYATIGAVTAAIATAKRSVYLLLKAQCGPRRASRQWQQHCMRIH